MLPAPLPLWRALRLQSRDVKRCCSTLTSSWHELQVSGTGCCVSALAIAPCTAHFGGSRSYQSSAGCAIGIAAATQGSGAEELVTGGQTAAPLVPLLVPSLPAFKWPGSSDSRGGIGLSHAAFRQRLQPAGMWSEAAWRRGFSAASNSGGSEQLVMVKRHGDGSLMPVTQSWLPRWRPWLPCAAGLSWQKSLRLRPHFPRCYRHSCRHAALKWRHICCGWAWSGPSCVACWSGAQCCSAGQWSSERGCCLDSW